MFFLETFALESLGIFRNFGAEKPQPRKYPTVSQNATKTTQTKLIKNKPEIKFGKISIINNSAIFYFYRYAFLNL